MVSVIILKFEIITKKNPHTHTWRNKRHKKCSGSNNTKAGELKRTQIWLESCGTALGGRGCVCSSVMTAGKKKAVTMRSKGLTGFVFFKHIKQMLAFAVTWSKKLRKPSIINSITNSVLSCLSSYSTCSFRHVFCFRRSRMSESVAPRRRWRQKSVAINPTWTRDLSFMLFLDSKRQI